MINNDISLADVDKRNNKAIALSKNVTVHNEYVLTFFNENNKKFSVSIEEVEEMITVLCEKNDEIANAIMAHDKYENSGGPWKFQEKPYRALSQNFFTLEAFPTINPLIGSQTSGIFNAIDRYICYLLSREKNEKILTFNKQEVGVVLNSLKLGNSGVVVPKRICRQVVKGPFNSVKVAALETLYYLYKEYYDKFLLNIKLENDKIKIENLSVYLWVTKSGIKAGADGRVFGDTPFVFNGNEYFLSDQWVWKDPKGRSIVDLNNFVNLFGYEIISENNKYYLYKVKSELPFSSTLLPKPFLLLAGISGTGKTRFVREQANASAALHQQPERSNYCLVPVRPDWHEPSDLLGYISRIGNDGTRYVVTDLLRFIVKAWKHAAQSATAEKIDCNPLKSICPFWLCLDEMNLAPVEQYFADYLSILETRKWECGVYSCDPILKSDTIDQLKADGIAAFWNDLELTEENPVNQGLKEYFSKVGIPLPPNLIVAGTVNMDETTHGFSRKVIDRALTLDFGEFYPNDYAEFFEPAIRPKTLGFPTLKQITKADLASVSADPDGTKTRNFLDGVNARLKGTPFELAYRALNEALLAVVCFNPKDDRALQAVWDDFLMMKVLPRIEGDAEKLGFDGERTGLLNDLATALKTLLPDVADTERPDLFREKAADGGEVTTGCRSLDKLGQMQKRLEKNSFTSFWP